MCGVKQQRMHTLCTNQIEYNMIQACPKVFQNYTFWFTCFGVGLRHLQFKQISQQILILVPANCNLSRESCKRDTPQSRNCFKDVFLCAVVAFSPLPLRIWHLYENWLFAYYQLSPLHWNKFSAFSLAPVQAWRKILNSFLFLGYAKLGKKNIK